MNNHSPPSPPGDAEKFFLSLSNTQTNISAYALAASLRSKDSIRSAASYTSVQSGYYTAEELDDTESLDFELEKEEEEETMANKKKNRTTAATAGVVAADAKSELKEKVAPVSAESKAPNQGVDVTQHVYEGVKDIWGAVAGVGVFSPFLKTAEGIANKILSAKGLDLEKIDSAVKPILSNVDGAVNPHITAIFEAVRPIVEKIMPVVMAPVGLIMREDKEKDAVSDSDESGNTPEVTPSPVVQ